MSDLFEQWLATGYKENWNAAYKLGLEARQKGLPRECNLDQPPFVHTTVLKVYKSAWEQGWDYPNFCHCPDESQVIWDGFGGGQCQKCKGHTF